MRKPVLNNFNRFIFNQFRKNEAKLHELNYLFWECTRRCNLRCLHCGSDCAANSAVKDIPFSDFLNAVLPLKEKYKDSVITVAITGGEPLLREDLAQCGMTLRKHGFYWGIVTNGYAYTPAVHNALILSGMGSITVSLDGLEPTHNWLRANNQSFEKAVQALDLITASPRLNSDVVTCVHQRNIHELDALKEFLVSRHVKAWRLFTISPIGRAVHNNDLHLTPPQLKQLLDFIVTARKDKRIQVTLSCGDYTGSYEGKVRDAYFYCRAGIQIASVLIDGSISACPNINRSFIQGSIYRDNFMDVWENRFQIMRDRNWTKTGICKNCDSFKHCDGGPMHLWNEKKDGIMTCVYQEIGRA